MNKVFIYYLRQLPEICTLCDFSTGKKMLFIIQKFKHFGRHFSHDNGTKVFGLRIFSDYVESWCFAPTWFIALFRPLLHIWISMCLQILLTSGTEWTVTLNVTVNKCHQFKKSKYQKTRQQSAIKRNITTKNKITNRGKLNLSTTCI